MLWRPLHSIVFDEHSRVIPMFKRQGRVSGLTVATPSGLFYRFESRRNSEDDIIDRDPNQILVALESQYQRSRHLELGTARDVQALMLMRYEPGVEFVVRSVDVERDRVRLSLHKSANSDLATTLTVQWPASLSREFTESALVEGVLARFLLRK